MGTTWERGPVEPRGRQARPRVLVIDDDIHVREILTDALTREGYAVSTAPHGAAALDLVKEATPAVIILDLRLPIMDGWSFAERYQRIAKAPAPIVLLSGVRDLEQSATRLRAAGFVRKPFEIDDVIAQVRRCVATP